VYLLVVLTLLLGAFASSGQGQTPTGLQPAAQDAVLMSMRHQHPLRALPMDAQQPQLALTLQRDAINGFNLQLSTAHFVLEPPGFEDNEPGITSNITAVRGHAHLYINTKKIQRIYGHFIHLPAELFSPGINQIHVTLNNHQHEQWSSGNQTFLATLFIDPGLEQPVKHHFSSSPLSAQ